MTCVHTMVTLGTMAKALKKSPIGPKKIERVAKDDLLRVRVTAEQKTAMVEAAEREGLELSQWLRQLALRADGMLPESTPSSKGR